jgi:hypothetical protein
MNEADELQVFFTHTVGVLEQLGIPYTSDKHLRDAQGVLIMRWGDLNLDLIRRTAGAAGVREAFEGILLAARREVDEGQGAGPWE